MKKDRNAFFSEYGLNGMNGNFNSNMMMPGGGGGYPGTGMNMPMPTDIDSRLAKLERGLNRLETRVSRLEGEGGSPNYETEYGINNNMYMV